MVEVVSLGFGSKEDTRAEYVEEADCLIKCVLHRIMLFDRLWFTPQNVGREFLNYMRDTNL